MVNFELESQPYANRARWGGAEAGIASSPGLFAESRADVMVVVLRLRRGFWLADWQRCDVMHLSGIIFTGGPHMMTRWAPVIVHGGVLTERVYQVRGMRIAGRTRYELHGGPPVGSSVTRYLWTMTRRASARFFGFERRLHRDLQN